jgi:hypothetical protein
MQGFLLEALGTLADETLLLLFLALLAIYVVVTELGFRLGRRVYTRRRAEETERSGVGFVTGVSSACSPSCSASRSRSPMGGTTSGAAWCSPRRTRSARPGCAPA